MDSLRVYKEADSFGCKKIGYDYENDWFITEDVGTGSSSISLRKSIVRVKKQSFHHVVFLYKILFCNRFGSFPFNPGNG